MVSQSLEHLKERSEKEFLEIKKTVNKEVVVCMLSHLDKHYDLNALYKKVKTCPNKSVPYKAEMKEFQHALEKLSARGLVKFEIDFTKNKITPAITKKGRLVLQLSKKASYHSAK